jgi:hypothetical protein
MAKKKKTFKGVTGIKFADLIMPLVLGGVGSYSPAAGRGVNLGLQAFRTLQSGREYQAERDAGKDVAEGFENMAQDLKDQKDTLQTGITREAPSETGRFGFYGDAGAKLPDPDRQVGEGQVEKQDILELAAGGKPEPQKFSAIMQNQGQAELGGVKETLEQALPVPKLGEAQQYQDAILQQKMETEDSAKRLGLIDRRIRFYEQMASLGAVNPGSASYLAGMEQLQHEKNIAGIEQRWDMHKIYTAGRVQEHKNKLIEMEYSRDTKMGLEKMKAEMDPLRFFQSGDTIAAFDPRSGKKLLTDSIGPRKLDKESWQGMGIEKRLGLLGDIVKGYIDVEQGIEDGFMLPDDQEVAQSREAYREMLKVVSRQDILLFEQQTGQKIPRVAAGGGGNELVPEDVEAEAERQRVLAAKQSVDF